MQAPCQAQFWTPNSEAENPCLTLKLCITKCETPQQDGQCLALTQQTTMNIYYLLLLLGLTLMTTISCGDRGSRTNA
jgi:hypothetical protein